MKIDFLDLFIKIMNMYIVLEGQGTEDGKKYVGRQCHKENGTYGAKIGGRTTVCHPDFGNLV